MNFVNKSLILYFLFLQWCFAADFNPSVNISTGLPALNTYPDMEVDNDGNIYVVWVNTSQGGDVLFSMSNNFGETFSDPVNVNQVPDHTTTIGYSGPQVEIWQDTIHVLWTDQRNGYSHTTAYYARSVDFGETWEEMRIGHENGVNFYPELLMDNHGTIHAAFHVYESGSFAYEHIMHRYSNDGGSTWSDFITVNTSAIGEPCDCCPLELFQLPNNQIITAFRNNESNIRDIYSIDWQPESENWENIERITHDEFLINYCPSSGPRFSAIDSRVAVTYMSDIIGENRVYVNVSTNMGESYDRVIPLVDSTMTNVYQNHPSITVTPDSTFHFLWEDTRYGGSIIYGALNVEDTTLTDYTVVGSVTTNSPELAPVIQSDSLGNLFAVWVGRQAGKHIHFATTYETDLEIEEESMANGFSLLKSYPNPFNPTMTIQFELAESQLEQHNISIQIFDISGRIVCTLFQGRLDAGNHSFQWNALKHPSGIYVTKIQSKNQIQTLKSIYLK